LCSGLSFASDNPASVGAFTLSRPSHKDPGLTPQDVDRISQNRMAEDEQECGGMRRRKRVAIAEYGLCPISIAAGEIPT
jgi:hypothetical protein